jgi:cardiolipin synthase
MMRTEEKSNVKNSISRLVVVGICILFQVGWLCLLVIRLNRHFAWISLVSSLLAVVLVIRIYISNGNAAFKMPWMILLLVFPPLGVMLWLMFGHSGACAPMRKRFDRIQKLYEPYRLRPDDALREAEAFDTAAANQMRYVRDYAGYPVYTDTSVQYYSDAMEGFLAQLEALEQAEHFIFMEYHAIEEAKSFGMLRDVLARKAAQGVEVRIFYDDMGSIGFINLDFIQRMQSLGIACRAFNPVLPFLNIFMNNRDHRKITVIDGKVGFTGGYNLADEYFNMTHPYGTWKDTGVKLTGAAVRSLTLMFLEMWNSDKHTDTDISAYLPECTAEGEGFVQPYADTPLDAEYVGENVYLNLIGAAKHRIYITTPYLIISDEMTRALGLAAKRGVDVRIITPGIPDKKVIYQVTRSYYAQLARQGVRIYEYTPGFIHSKIFVSDDEIASIGTANLDFRSLYLHFECGTLLYGSSAIIEAKNDFLATLDECKEIRPEDCKHGVLRRLLGSFMRLISPLL